MRIALVHYTFLPTVAGVEIVMAAHARLFWQHSHQVTIVADRMRGADSEAVEWDASVRFSATEPSVATESRPNATEVARLAIPNLSARSPLAMRAQGELAMGGAGLVFEQAVEALLAELRPVIAVHDVVMLHNIATMHFHLALTAAAGRLADEFPHVCFICWVHDLAACNPDYAPLPLERAPWSLLAQAHPRFTYVAVSELRRRQFSELTAQPLEWCRTIHNGVEPSRILDLSPQTSELARRLRLLDRDLVLIQPARLLRRKNIELTLRVVAAMKAAGHSCAALITAPPDVHSDPSAAYPRELRLLHRQLELTDDVFFLHDHAALDDRALREIYQIGDALFFPSWQEGFGLPLLEAALHRLPIFCSDIEPLRHLLPGGVTTFAPDARPDDIAQKVVATVRGDPAYVARRHTLQHFSWAAIYRNFLSPLLAEIEPLFPA